MECTLQEERSLKQQVESKLLQLEKEHSMLDCDCKQALQKLGELQGQKEKLSEEVCLSLFKRTCWLPADKYPHLPRSNCKLCFLCRTVTV